MGDFLYGALSGCIAEILTIPLDTIKVRMQLDRSLSIKDTLKILMVEGGMISLFAGLQPALLRQLLYSSSRYGMYPILKNILSGSANSNENTLFVKLLAGLMLILYVIDLISIVQGCLSGAIASGICSPTDLIRFIIIIH